MAPSDDPQTTKILSARIRLILDWRARFRRCGSGNYRSRTDFNTTRNHVIKDSRRKFEEIRFLRFIDLFLSLLVVEISDLALHEYTQISVAIDGIKVVSVIGKTSYNFLFDLRKWYRIHSVLIISSNWKLKRYEKIQICINIRKLLCVYPKTATSKAIRQLFQRSKPRLTSNSKTFLSILHSQIPLITQTDPYTAYFHEGYSVAWFSIPILRFLSKL